MKTNRLAAGVALSIVLACGTAQAGPSGSASVFVPSQTQRVTAPQSFAWLDRDTGLLDRAVPATHRFVESPGVMERQARMVAKVRDRADMARQAAIEVSQVAVAVPRQAAGAVGAGGVSVAPIWDRADERLVEARSRLAPVLIEAHPEVDTHAFRLPEGWTEEQIADVLMATGDYEYVEPDWRVYPLATVPNDPQFNQQWHHRAQNMNSVGAWDFETGGNEIILASCDTGVIPNHQDLNPLVPGFNSTTNLAQVNGGVTNDLLNGHGTLVAGTMAARGNNGVGIAGAGWNFRVMPIRVSDRADGTADLSEILQGARWASDNGAFVANCSYGGGNTSQSNTAGNYIRQRNALLVFATGNDSVQDQNADRVFVTLVGATTSTNAVANFSNYGIGVDVVAPGVGIRSTTRTGGYSNVTGTSFAAPLVAGVMGLVKSANPDLTADQVEQIIKDTAIDIGAPGFDIFAGHGMVNASAAVQAAIFGPSVVDLPFSDGFATGTLSNLWRDPVGTPEVSIAVGDFALNLDGTESIRTVGLRAAFLFDSVGQISFDVQHRGVENGKSMRVEYADIIGNWQTLTTIVSDGADSTQFERMRVGVPLFGLHDELKIRFVAQGADATDDWYIDNVLVAEFVRNTIPWQVGFENGLDTTFDWANAQAIATTEAPNTPEGDFSGKLVGAASMTSRPLDITSITNLPYFRMRTLHTGVESGKTLTVEYLDLLGNWQALTSIVSDGVNQTAFELLQVQMPFAAFGTDLQVRITANGADQSDVWYIDDVAITEELVTEPPSCPQDIDGNGLLNFFDISSFLALYNAQNPVADWDGNGLFNFFDISSYLASYNAGCP